MFIRLSATFYNCGFFYTLISLIGFYFNSFLTKILVLF